MFIFKLQIILIGKFHFSRKLISKLRALKRNTRSLILLNQIKSNFNILVNVEFHSYQLRA